MTLSSLLARIGFAEKSALLTMAVAATAFYVFSELADEVSEGETRAFDEAVLLAFRNPQNLSDPLGPRWLEEMMRDFTALGSFGVLTVLTLVVIGFLVLVRKRHAALMVAGAVIGGVLASHLLKWVFDRSRPDLVPHGAFVTSQSFPSGHAMLSAVVFLTLGALLARSQENVRLKIYFLSIAACLTVVVGISRIYLGVHWPTDVIAGWVVGIGWALLCWLTMLWLQGRGKVEPESNNNG
ncbi:phosphatase PAP2 family protein [Noviherbaspirillum sedimenti]|nr:phosphatase PAP2 family protein [Noviherbaspirillum sedimenti]